MDPRLSELADVLERLGAEIAATGASAWSDVPARWAASIRRTGGVSLRELTNQLNGRSPFAESLPASPEVGRLFGRAAALVRDIRADQARLTKKSHGRPGP